MVVDDEQKRGREEEFERLKQSIKNTEEAGLDYLREMLTVKADDLLNKCWTESNSSEIAERVYVKAFESSGQMIEGYLRYWVRNLTGIKKKNILALASINELIRYFNNDLDRFCRMLSSPYYHYQDEFNKVLPEYKDKKIEEKYKESEGEESKKTYEKDIVNLGAISEEKGFQLRDMKAIIPGEVGLEEIDAELRSIYREIRDYLEAVISRIPTPQLGKKLRILNSIFIEIDADGWKMNDNQRYTLLLVERIFYLRSIFAEFTTKDSSNILLIADNVCRKLVPCLAEATEKLAARDGAGNISLNLGSTWLNCIKWCEKNKVEIKTDSGICYDYYAEWAETQQQGILRVNARLFELAFNYKKHKFDFAHYKSKARKRVRREAGKRYVSADVDELFGHWAITERLTG